MLCIGGSCHGKYIKSEGHELYIPASSSGWPLRFSYPEECLPKIETYSRIKIKGGNNEIIECWIIK